MDNKSSKFLDEFAKLVTDAAGLAQGAKGEVENIMKSQGERLLADMDLVDRDSFEAVKALAQEMKAEIQELKQEIEKLKKAKK